MQHKQPDLFVDTDIRKAFTLPSEFFTSEELLLQSKEKIFARSWQWIAVVHATKEPGDVWPFVLLPGLLDEPLLLARNESGKIQCLSNVCTHRGNIIVEKRGNCKKLRCRYHGRRFSLDGKFEHMPDFEEVENFPCEDDDLKVIPISIFKSHLFASLDPKISAEELFAPIHERVGWIPLENLLLDSTRSKTYQVKCHWATYCDNYLEGFHIPFVHPELNKALEPTQYETHLFKYGSLQIGIAREGDVVFELPESSPDFGKRVAAYYFFLFPNLMLNFYPWGLSLNHISPKGVNETEVRFLSYVWKPELLGVGAGAGLDKVELEDEQIVESVSRGLRSSFYKRGRFSPTKEQAVHHFHRLISQFMTT